MTPVPQKSAWLWIAAAVLACAFVVWSDVRRARRVAYVSGLAQTPETASASGARQLIVPERAEPAWHWLAQTQQMLRQRELRVARVDYDNAPFGREVSAPSLYRWWIGLVAVADHWITGAPLVRAVERAALVADPLLHVFAILGLAALAAWRFGALAATLGALGLAMIYPAAAGFLPGIVDQHGAARLLATGSVLAILAGIRGPGSPRGWFAAAGALAGLALWLDVPLAVPVLIGEFAGALFLCATRGGRDDDGQVWRWWGLAGAVTALIGYMVESAPDRLGGWHLETVHPVHALAWIGAAELAALGATAGRAGGEKWMRAAGALAAVGALPVATWWADSRGFMATDVLSVRLTSEPGGVAADGLWSLLRQNYARREVWALLLPLLGAVPALTLLWSREMPAPVRRGVAFALVVAVVVCGFAMRELAMFQMFGLSLLVLAIAGAIAPLTRRQTLICAAGAGALLLPGLLRVVPPRFMGDQTVLTRVEAEELIERDLGRWLSKHANGASPIVYAPPHVSTTLCYYGALRGLGSFDPDNRAGFGAALNIAGARTMEEVQAAVQVRDIGYVVVPSWDPFFDEFASRYLAKGFSNRTSFFVSELQRWNLPLWLRPVAYQLPAIPGFERESVQVFEVVEEQRPAVAAGRLVECLLEEGLTDEAFAALPILQRFPGDCGALAARAQVLSGRDDAAGVAQVIGELRARISAGGDRYLPWDRRVALATVLAQANELELARDQLARCIVDPTPERLRALNPGSLYRLLVLCQAFHLPLPKPELQTLALSLLPADLRAQL